jgi:hypothetical protein
MAGLVPAIHVFLYRGTKDVDARLKAGHDEVERAELAYARFFARIRSAKRSNR